MTYSKSKKLNMNINDIKNWDDWCQCFQNINTFKDLIHKICIKHHLPFSQIENTYPGTNAVFSVGHYVIKIFVPFGIKNWANDDYQIELNSVLNMKNNHSSVKIYGHGIINLEKEWKYIIFEKIEGKHFKDIIHTLTIEDKKIVIHQLKAFLKDFNKTAKGNEESIITRIIYGDRWSYLSENVLKEFHQYLEKIDLSESVWVHGDLTGDNIIYKNKDIFVIDFGDVCVAPKYYEYAPIVYDLFEFDHELIDLFFDGKSIDQIIHPLMKSIFIHDFGGLMVKHLIKNPEFITSFEELQERLYEQLSNRLKK